MRLGFIGLEELSLEAGENSLRIKRALEATLDSSSGEVHCYYVHI